MPGAVEGVEHEGRVVEAALVARLAANDEVTLDEDPGRIALGGDLPGGSSGTR